MSTHTCMIKNELCICFGDPMWLFNNADTWIYQWPQKKIVGNVNSMSLLSKINPQHKRANLVFKINILHHPPNDVMGLFSVFKLYITDFKMLCNPFYCEAWEEILQ